jgi:hypothetical protein
VPDFIELDLTTDADTLQQAGEDRFAELAPDGYTIDVLFTWLLAAVARIAAEVAVLAGDVPDEIFQTFGQKVLRIDAHTDTAATGLVEFTLTDSDGHTVPAGAQIDIDGVGFQTTADLTIAMGDTTGQVGVIAVVAGADGSGLTGLEVTLISPTYVWVDSVALIGQTQGGRDGESPQEYVDRLADELPTLSPKAILIDDFAAIARVDDEVVRALAIDNYVPAGPGGIPAADPAAEGAVTVAVLADGGATVSTDGKARVQAALQDGRVLNLDVHVIDPTVTPVDVTFVATARAGSDPAAVEAEAEAAIAAFLSAERWGVPPGANLTEWVDEPTVKANDLIGELYKVDGLRHVTSLTLGRARNVTIAAATDTATSTAHGYSNGDEIVFDNLVGGAPLVNGTHYFARDITANTFKIAATSGGAAIDITTDATAGKVSKVTTGDVALDGPAAVPAANAVRGTVT